MTKRTTLRTGLLTGMIACTAALSFAQDPADGAPPVPTPFAAEKTAAPEPGPAPMKFEMRKDSMDAPRHAFAGGDKMTTEAMTKRADAMTQRLAKALDLTTTQAEAMKATLIKQGEQRQQLMKRMDSFGENTFRAMARNLAPEQKKRLAQHREGLMGQLGFGNAKTHAPDGAKPMFMNVQGPKDKMGDAPKMVKGERIVVERKIGAHGAAPQMGLRGQPAGRGPAMQQGRGMQQQGMKAAGQPGRGQGRQMQNPQGARAGRAFMGRGEAAPQQGQRQMRGGARQQMGQRPGGAGL